MSIVRSQISWRLSAEIKDAVPQEEKWHDYFCSNLGVVIHFVGFETVFK
jgi:hypothetical protein